MDAVMRIVAVKGLKGATYRAIGTEAGVNHNLINHHFGSLDALLNETMERAVDLAIRNTEMMLFGAFDERYADALLASVAAEPEVHVFQFEMLLEARRRPTLLGPSRNLYENYARSIRTVLSAQGIEADDALSAAVFAALDGLMLQFLTIGEPESIKSAVVQLGQLVREGTTSKV